MVRSLDLAWNHPRLQYLILKQPFKFNEIGMLPILTIDLIYLLPISSVCREYLARLRRYDCSINVKPCNLKKLFKHSVYKWQQKGNII